VAPGAIRAASWAKLNGALKGSAACRGNVDRARNAGARSTFGVTIAPNVDRTASNRARSTFGVAPG
jgi:hypothetical protein